jgi:hypothetical protein
MSSLPARAAGQPSAAVLMTAEEREQLHSEARTMQQYLCTSCPRNQFGKEECDFMLAALDIGGRSCTQEEADADLKEILELIIRIVE